MQAIEYAAPTRLADAVALLSDYGDRARILAGGTDLIVQIREHLRDVDLVVDGKQIPELEELTYRPGEGLVLGAAVSCRRIAANPEVRAHYPGLAEAAALIGGTAIQSRASVGGNLCNSGPAADSTPALIALDALAVIAGPHGERRVPVHEFCTGPSQNVLGRGELLVALRLPDPGPRSGSAYLRFIPRNEMDIAEAGVGAALGLEADGRTIASARIGLGAVAPTPLLADAAGASLVGQPAGPEAFSRAGELARAACRPITDMRGTVEHRLNLIAVLTRRALTAAAQRALGE